jgi:sortase B
MLNHNNKFRAILILFLWTVLLYSTAKIGIYINEWYSNKKINGRLSEIYHQSDITKIADTNTPNQNTDRFKELLDINKDVVGWIKIPGTKIDYPVVQGDNNQFYLNHDINKEISSHGSIFMDYRSSHDEELNTVIYGHNMKDGSMFAGLSQYKKADFYEKNPYIEYDSLGQSMKWQIFSVYIYQLNDDYFKVYFNDSKEYYQYLDEIIFKSIYDTGVVVTQEDKILTLMTCSYETNDSRIVIHAKRV